MAAAKSLHFIQRVLHQMPPKAMRRSNGFVSQNGVRICIMMQISGPDLYYSPYWKVAKVTRGERVGYLGHLEFVSQCRATKYGL